MGETISSALQAKLGIDLSQFERGLNRAVSDAQRVGGRFATSFGVMRRAARRVAVATLAIGAAITGIGALAVREFVQWEAAMTGVAKTVDASAEVIASLGREFVMLSEQIPVASVELANIGEIAGQLGIQVPNILAFTEVIAALAVSTNLTAEAAATSLAQLGNIMGTAQTQFGRLGSVIVELGNSLATNEAMIVNFGLRMAGAGRIAHLTEANVLSIAGAFASVGVEAEAGGTAVQKVLIQISTAVQKGGDELAAFAEVAGSSSADFATAWREDAGLAFTDFVEGLGRSGDRAASVLETLDIVDQRSIKAFISLANAGSKLRESIGQGTEAWIENTALTAEAARFYDRLGARLVSLRNKISNTAAEIGEVLTPVVDAGITVVSGFLDQIRGAGPAIEDMASAMARRLPGAIESIVRGVGSLGVAVLEAVEIASGLQFTAGLGLVGLVFLGPQGAAALAAIGFVIDALIEKLGGPVTVAEALNKKLTAAIDRQAELVALSQHEDLFFLGRPRSLQGIDFLEEARQLGLEIEGIKNTIKNLEAEDFAPVSDGFGQWRESLEGVFGRLEQFELRLSSVGGALPAGPIGGESPAEVQSRLNVEAERTITLFENLKPLVGEVPMWVREAEAAVLEWDSALMRVGETIRNQVAGGIAEIALNLDSFLGTIKSVGRAIMREIVAALIKAKIEGAALSSVFASAGPLGIALAGFGLISQFFQSGGIVKGSGEVPVMAHAGEVVLSREAVNRLGGAAAANRMNEPSFGQSFIAPPIPRAPVPAMAGAGGGGTTEIVFRLEGMPEPADFGIIGSRGQAARLFAAFVANHKNNGGTF